MLLSFLIDPPPPEIYTLSLHDALPILPGAVASWAAVYGTATVEPDLDDLQREFRVRRPRDRKSTRLNSSHVEISYAVFCLKKKKPHSTTHPLPHTALWYTNASRLFSHT